MSDKRTKDHKRWSSSVMMSVKPGSFETAKELKVSIGRDISNALSLLAPPENLVNKRYYIRSGCECWSECYCDTKINISLHGEIPLTDKEIEKKRLAAAKRKLSAQKAKQKKEEQEKREFRRLQKKYGTNV